MVPPTGVLYYALHGQGAYKRVVCGGHMIGGGGMWREREGCVVCGGHAWEGGGGGVGDVPATVVVFCLVCISPCLVCFISHHSP